LRGEIARDAFAVAIADQCLIRRSHEKFFRNMLYYGVLDSPDQKPTLEDVAVEVSDYFWEVLYKPYPGFERRKPFGLEQSKEYLEKAVSLIFRKDWEGLKHWLTDHAKFYRKKKLREVRGDSVLLSWLKYMNSRGFLANWHEAICLLIQAWPEQINLCDFKGQTPLMLAADAGDEVLVQAFLEVGADVNTTDCRGRTALHAAILGRSENCLAAILRKKPDTRKVTCDGQTAMHTAVRMAHPGFIRCLTEYDPTLRNRENQFGQTPLNLAHAILDNLDEYKKYMEHEKRYVPSRTEMEAVVAELEKHVTPL
jgi:hypothetical protein